MAKLSVVISAFNEEKNIKGCLESVRDLADEIILIDNTSTDKTVEITRKYEAKIYSQPNRLMLNINKNFGFEKASGEWILSLDADERVTPELENEIKSEIRNPKSEINGFWIPRENILFGKWIKSQMWWPDEQLRLFRKGKGEFPERHVHEYLKVDGQTAHLKNPLIHLNYTSVSQFLYKLDKIYTENEVENFLKSGRKISWNEALKWPVSDFLKTFFAQKGYKDGLHGLVLSLLQAFYAEVTFAKAWERQGFSEIEIDHQEFARELRKLIKELNYWLLTTELKESKNPFKKLLLKIKRRGGF
ncbi:glycosyltransferase family 2 protein [Candidatus Gottesmanbacteria bacterium]|nr:glycosyltransferase family 2 protein [Candidatus Gottesmanbacteria bacterium]